MSEYTPPLHQAVELPSPKMLHHLKKAAFTYAASLEQGVVVASDRPKQSIYYLKDFRLRNNQRVGRVARFSRVPTWVVGEDQYEFTNGQTDHFSFYYSERIESDQSSVIDEEWQAFGYRWSDEDGLLRARRWIERQPAHGEARAMAVSTAADVAMLLRRFRAHLQQDADDELAA